MRFSIAFVFTSISKFSKMYANETLVNISMIPSLPSQSNNTLAIAAATKYIRMKDLISKHTVISGV